MKKYDMIKGAVGVVVSASVGLVVGHTLNAFTPADLGRIAKIGTKIGKVAIGMTASDVVVNHITKSIDDVFIPVKNAVEEVVEIKTSSK